MKRSWTALIVLLILFSCSGKQGVTASTDKKARELAADIESRLPQLPRTPIDYDRSLLNDNDTKVVMKLIETSKLIDQIFWRQVSMENPGVREELVKAAATSKAHATALQWFDIMKGRWDRLEQNEPFIGPFGEAGKKPKGAGFYPADMTKEEFERWIQEHPEDKESFQSITTVIVRKDGKLQAVPYSSYYVEFLKPAAAKLREAASMAQNNSLRDFLSKRADSFLSDDYYQSDFAWMDLDSPIEIVIGPYEVYEDGMFNYKASFESFLAVVDKTESEKLKVYASHLPDMEKKLPMPDEHKNPNRGTESPIRVVQEIYTAGDARKGVMTAAFNLPNDERVREAKGSKKILLKNVMEAKFHKTGEPVAKRVLDPSQAGLLSFDAYFNHTLFHELSHGLGPGIITGPDGKKVENRLLLKNLYAPIEECKADVLGTWTLLYAIDNKLLTSFDKETLYGTYAALMFRLMRHGIDEAHGRGNAVQWIWLREKGAIVPTSDNRFKIVSGKMLDGVQSLANELLMIEATGDYARAERLLNQYGKSNAEIDSVIQGLKDIPVDIAPVFVAAGE